MVVSVSKYNGKSIKLNISIGIPNHEMMYRPFEMCRSTQCSGRTKQRYRDIIKIEEKKPKTKMNFDNTQSI